MRPAALLLALSALSAACGGDPAGPCAAAGPLAGRWHYTGWQDTPSAATREGTLEIGPDACPDLRGALDVVETQPGRPPVRRAGQLFGVAAGDVVRLDALLDGATVEHAARLRGDSLTGGTWTATSGGQVVARGRFGARRATP